VTVTHADPRTAKTAATWRTTVKIPGPQRSGQKWVRAVAVAAMVGGSTTAAQATVLAATSPLQNIVPAPVSVRAAAGVSFPLTASTKIYTQANSADAKAVGGYLAEVLRRSTGFALPVSNAPTTPSDGITLLLSGADSSVGAQGYQLNVTAGTVVLRANTGDGLFSGVQTLRQLLPAKIESATAQPGPWTIPGTTVVDYPRFAYRGAMLDVARHFLPVAAVKRYIDQIALYKINHLHLHLADDQGWRIEIDSWPKLTTVGGRTQVGGGAGGFYTKAQYADLIAYATSRHITVIPEIDVPGHTNAAQSSYAELNCDGVAPAPRTDIEVGYSSLCIGKAITYRFLTDVIRELAAMTPGPYLHIGGDEAMATTPADYLTFVNKVLPIVAATGKQAIGWHEIAKATLPASVVPQYWGTTTSDADVSRAVSGGSKVILSPANKTYLDMQYNASSPLGLHWAGYVEVRDAYDWNPGTYLNGVPESAVQGVESPLWTETVETSADIEYLAFPRLAAHAELAWSPWSTHDWDTFKARLGAQGPRWLAQGINFYRSAQVPWEND
jgi:hexosaminidase